VSFSGFDLPEELEMLKAGIARFVGKEIRLVEDALPPDACAIPPEQVRELQARARMAGYWMLPVPEKFGGAGLSTWEFVVAMEEAGKHRFSMPEVGGGAFGHTPPSSLYDGTPDQIERYLLPTVEHSLGHFSVLSEPSGGSDPARAIRTTARRVGDTYVLNGTKMWATGADTASYGIVYARTDTSAGRGGISAFIVDAGTPGMTVTPIPVIRDYGTTEITFDDCVIPAANLLGEEGGGFALGQEWLVKGRLYIAAVSVGVAAEAIRLAIEWVQQRETFGALLATRQAVQFAIADSAVELRAARWLTWEAAWQDDRDEDARYEASVAKLYATEMAFRVVDRMMQFFGGIGVARGFPLEAWFRGLRVWRIGEGASEIQRFLIARDLLGPAALGTSASVNTPVTSGREL
jgi:acyl-CoA dehydrogenase